MYINEITKYDKKRYKICTDECSFLLYYSDIKQLNLAQDMYIDDTVKIHIFDDILYKRAKERALHLLDKSDKTKGQIINKLRVGYYPVEIQERVIEFLERYGYINDYEYAKRYAEYKITSKSLNSIREDLVVKGISRDIIQGVLNEMDDIEDIQKMQIFKLLDKKKYKECANDIKKRNRIVNCLLRRGYSYDFVLNVLNEYIEYVLV